MSSVYWQDLCCKTCVLAVSWHNPVRGSKRALRDVTSWIAFAAAEMDQKAVSQPVQQQSPVKVLVRG